MDSQPFEICVSKPEVAVPGLPVIPAFGPVCLNSRDEMGCIGEIEFSYIDQKGICDSMGGVTTIDHYWFKRVIEIRYERIHVETVEQIREFLWACQWNNKTPLLLEINEGCCEYYRTDEPIEVYLELENELLTSRSKNGCWVEDFELRFTEYGTCHEGFVEGAVGVAGLDG